MTRLEITFDYENDGICWEHPTYSYSPSEQTVYTLGGWKIWAKTEADAVYLIERDIVSKWIEDYAEIYKEKFLKNKEKVA